MANMYNAGNGAGQVTLAVDISTFGLAASRAVVIDSSNNQTTVAHSVNATGDIAQQQIGAANTLSGKWLRVLTKVDIVSNDQNERQQEYNNITAAYTLDGGADGNKVFNAADTKTASDDFTTAFLLITIQLS